MLRLRRVLCLSGSDGLGFGEVSGYVLYEVLGRFSATERPGRRSCRVGVLRKDR